MSVLSTIYPTLLDQAKREDPNGKIAKIVEILTLQNPMLEDMTMLEANGPVSHRTTIRSGLPTPTWKKLNYGIQPTKSRTVQVTDTLGHLSDLAEVDADLLELNGNSADFVLSEHVAHLEGMNEEAASTLIYGNESTDTSKFTGLAARYNSRTAENGGNIVNPLASLTSTAGSSIWLIGWGPNTIHGIFPKGSKAGLATQDYGIVMSENQGGAGLRGRVHRTSYDWKLGLCVRDWRYAVRIPFVPASVVASAATGLDFTMAMAAALHRIPALGLCRPVFYANRDTLTLIDQQGMSRSTLAFHTILDAQGHPITTFRGVPLKRCDAITNAETVTGL